MKVTVCRKAHFNAAHQLLNKDWSDEKNRKIFGKCFNPNFHGHNYNLIVKVSGEIDQETGYVMDLGVLDKIIDREVLQKFDHKNLNIDTDEFKNLNPTAENIAVVIWNILRPIIDAKHDLNVVLYETERNFVEFGGN